LHALYLVLILNNNNFKNPVLKGDRTEKAASWLAYRCRKAKGHLEKQEFICIENILEIHLFFSVHGHLQTDYKIIFCKFRYFTIL